MCLHMINDSSFVYGDTHPSHSIMLHISHCMTPIRGSCNISIIYPLLLYRGIIGRIIAVLNKSTQRDALDNGAKLGDVKLGI
jgi:hypothetical protein